MKGLFSARHKTKADFLFSTAEQPWTDKFCWDVLSLRKATSSDWRILRLKMTSVEALHDELILTILHFGGFSWAFVFEYNGSHPMTPANHKTVTPRWSLSIKLAHENKDIKSCARLVPF